jgi:hypothetical protein
MKQYISKTYIRNYDARQAGRVTFETWIYPR